MKDATTKKEWHYVFRVHILCDAKYGLLIKRRLTSANNSEQTELDILIKDLESSDSERYKLEKWKILWEMQDMTMEKETKKLKEEYNNSNAYNILEYLHKKQYDLYIVTNGSIHCIPLTLM